MNIISISVLAVVTVIISVTLRPKNGEIAVMLVLCGSAAILLSVLSNVSGIVGTISSIAELSSINPSYITILLKVIGICLTTELAVNSCKDAGCQALAGAVLFSGKILAMTAALPLYAEILNTVVAIFGGR